MVEALRRFLYFHISGRGVTCTLVMKRDISQDLVGFYQYAKTYQNIPYGLSAMAIFANWPRTDRQTHQGL